MVCQWMRLSRESSNIYVFASKEKLDSILELMYIYYNISFINEPENNGWKIILDNLTNRFYLTDYYKVIKTDMSLYNEPNRTYHLNPEAKEIKIIYPNDPVWQIQVCVRLIRGISRSELNLDKTIYFHSGMVIYEGKGICVMGSKKAGKTSTIMSLLCSGSAKFISNDDLSVKVYKEEVIGYGWPRAISVRNDTFDALKVFNSFDDINESDFSHPSNKINQNLNVTFLYPHEIAKLLKTELVDVAKVDYILFPQFIDSGEPKIERIGKKEFKELLRENIEFEINKCFKDLEYYFKKDFASPTTTCNLDIIAEKTKGYRLYQNFNSLNISSRLLSEVIYSG